MKTTEEYEARREAILAEMRSLRCMRRGTVAKQYLKVRHKGRDEPVVRGPYYTLARWEGGKTVSKRLRSAEELTRAQEERAAHRRFVELCKEFEEVTERLLDLGRTVGDGAVKKTPRSRSSRAGR